jgi:hypothetical protein
MVRYGREDSPVGDKEWLEKVRIALIEYHRLYPCVAAEAEIFVRWLYEQYGIVYKGRDDQ